MVEAAVHSMNVPELKFSISDLDSGADVCSRCKMNQMQQRS